MNIKLKISKEFNFLMIIYQKLKQQQMFENLNFNLVDTLTKENRKIIKSILRSGNISFEEIEKNELLGPIYRANKNSFDDYWDKNLDGLKLITKELQKRLNKFNLELFDKVGLFFSKIPPKDIIFWVCMGNITSVGSGNAFSPNLGVLFPRKFDSFDLKSIEFDFAVLIHEIVHLCQNMCGETDKKLLENVTKCFAPRGILINEDKMREEEYNSLYRLVKESFLNEESFADFKTKYKTLNN